jgi:hypothetical protein
VLQKFRADLELRVKKLFAVLHVKSHLTGAGICKREGCPPIPRPRRRFTRVLIALKSLKIISKPVIINP